MTTAIAVFAYQRSLHLSRVLQSLASNPNLHDFHLIIYVDGPKSIEQSPQVDAVIQVASAFAAEHPNAEVILRPTNLGLYKSLTTGVTETFRRFDKAIIIEDDILCSEHTLSYFNEALRLYENAQEVASIHAYLPPLKYHFPKTFFLRGADCWGWATWKNRWLLFRHDADSMAKEIYDRGLAYEFNLCNTYNYLGMLEARAANENNSWAICWHASCFLANKFTLYPGRSLVKNIGLDNSGEHCGVMPTMNSEVSTAPILVSRQMPSVRPNVYYKYCAHFSETQDSLTFYKLAIKEYLKSIRRVFRPPTRSGERVTKLNLIGVYEHYEDALKASTAYSHPAILAKVRTGIIDVLEERAAYERDGTAFASPPTQQAIRAVLSLYLQPNDVILDIGGGLGGTFINNRDLFSDSHKYVIVEQPEFVQAGCKLAVDYLLPFQFFSSLDELHVQPSVVLLSSVLTYLPDPASVLKAVSDFAPRIIIVDRTAISDTAQDYWYLQYEESYYDVPVSYPFKPLNSQLLPRILVDYDNIYEWVNTFDCQIPPHRGLLYQRKKIDQIY